MIEMDCSCVIRGLEQPASVVGITSTGLVASQDRRAYHLFEARDYGRGAKISEVRNMGARA